jgi:hypothetical protein
MSIGRWNRAWMVTNLNKIRDEIFDCLTSFFLNFHNFRDVNFKELTKLDLITHHSISFRSKLTVRFKCSWVEHSDWCCYPCIWRQMNRKNRQFRQCHTRSKFRPLDAINHINNFWRLWQNRSFWIRERRLMGRRHTNIKSHLRSLPS